jgi:phenylacetate-CoA ligase
MTQMDQRGYKRYWDEERETMDPKQRDTLVLERLQEQLRYVYYHLPFYGRLYDQHHVKLEDIKSLEDFTEKIPIVDKRMLVDDQKEFPPYGSYAGDFKEDEIIRIHGSSGTSGVPTFYRVSRKDWERAAEAHAMAQWCAGIRPNDIVQVGFSYSLFFGGWGVNQGSERLGATVFPLGAIDSQRQIELMFRIGSTVFSATPSYCMHLISVAERLNLDLRNGPVQRLLVGGEAGGSVPGTKQALEQGWGASSHDCASSSEMYPFQTNVECEASPGMHVFTDEVYAEVVDKDNPQLRVPDGTAGAAVYTHLWRESQPMIRFWPGDETIMTHESCPCGRTYPRLPQGIIGRLDDCLIIRGVNVYPSTIETVLRTHLELGPEFMIVLDKQGVMDEISLQAEYSVHLERALAGLSEESVQAQLARLANSVSDELKRVTGLRIPTEIVKPGTLPATVFKAKRVLDRRVTP